MLKSRLKKVVSLLLHGKPRPIYARIVCLEPSKKLEGKKVIVTGGGSGLGYAMAKRFVEEGAEVLISGRNIEKLSKSAAEIGCKYLQLDVQDTSAYDTFLEKADEILGERQHCGDSSGAQNSRKARGRRACRKKLPQVRDKCD